MIVAARLQIHYLVPQFMIDRTIASSLVGSRPLVDHARPARGRPRVTLDHGPVSSLRISVGALDRRA